MPAPTTETVQIDIEPLEMVYAEMLRRIESDRFDEFQQRLLKIFFSNGDVFSVLFYQTEPRLVEGRLVARCEPLPAAWEFLSALQAGPDTALNMVNKMMSMPGVNIHVQH